MLRVKRFYRMSLAFGFFGEFITIYPIYNLIFKDSGILPMQVSVLLIIQKACKMLADLPVGLASDRYGRRSVLILGMMLKAAMLFLFWTSNSFFSFAVAMGMWGISMSCSFGSESSYFYDFMRIKKIEKKFPIFMGFYYAFQNIATVIACYVGGYSYTYDKPETAVMISLFMVLVAIFFALLLPKYTSRHLGVRFPNESIPIGLGIKVYAKELFKKQTLLFVFLTSVSSAVFLFFFDLGTLIMGSHKFDAETIALVVGGVAGLRVVSNACAGFFVRKFSMQTIIISVALLLLSVAVLGALRSTFVIVAISAYLVLFAVIDIAINTRMHDILSSQTRAAIAAVGNLLASFILIFLHFGNGYFATEDSYMLSAKILIGVIGTLMLGVGIGYTYIASKSARNS